jgi:signal peptidase I
VDRVIWIGTACLGALALVCGAGLWARRHLVVVTVNGSSMEPTLSPGDRVLIRRRKLSRVHRGQLVVVEPPAPAGVRRVGTTRGSLDHRLWNIKRAVALPGDPVPSGIESVGGARSVPPGALVLLGDSVYSTDSRQRGFYFAADLLGVVVGRMSAAPPGKGPAQTG